MWIQGWDKQSTGPFLYILPSSMKGSVGGIWGSRLSPESMPVDRMKQRCTAASIVYLLLFFLYPVFQWVAVVTASVTLELMLSAFTCPPVDSWHSCTLWRGLRVWKLVACCQIQESPNHILPLAVLVAITFIQSNLKRICWVISVVVIKCNMREVLVV